MRMGLAMMMMMMMMVRVCEEGNVFFGLRVLPIRRDGAPVLTRRTHDCAISIALPGRCATRVALVVSTRLLLLL